MFGALRPIVAPADDNVAAVHRVAVLVEILALKFKFDVRALPAARSDQTLGFAVGESLLHRFDTVAKFAREHSKEEHDALFVHGFMQEP